MPRRPPKRPAEPPQDDLTDDPFVLFDEIARLRVASYAIDEQRRVGEKAAREKGTVVAAGNTRYRPS